MRSMNISNRQKNKNRNYNSLKRSLIYYKKTKINQIKNMIVRQKSSTKKKVQFKMKFKPKRILFKNKQKMKIT